MIETAIAKLEFLVDTIPHRMLNISSETFKLKPAPNKWSQQEIVGHLIDSAANNHQRFIRTQYEDVPVIFYNQDKWNELSHYQLMDSVHVIHFWKIYNQHILEVIKRIPPSSLIRECNTGEAKNVTLHFLIVDYVEHMEHHLKQIFGISE
jgi:hypothetical protein